jgi:RNase P/RNase MRP subunit POP5
VELLGEPIPPRRLEFVLRSAIPAGTLQFAPRVLRAQGIRAIVEVEHADAARARAAWNATLRPPGTLPITVRTHRTWGTVRGGRAWVKGTR